MIHRCPACGAPVHEEAEACECGWTAKGNPMTLFAAVTAATLLLSEPLPPNCGQLRPEIMHVWGGPWVVAAAPDDDGPPAVEFWMMEDALGQADRIQRELCERMER